jgi:hypothetical protein
MARHIWSSKQPVYQDAVRASHVLGVMIAKLTGGSPPPLPTGTIQRLENLQYSSTAAQTSFPSQADTVVPHDSTYDMMDTTSLESIFENPDMLNWVSMRYPKLSKTTDPSPQNDIDNYLVDYSSALVPARFDMSELVI